MLVGHYSASFLVKAIDRNLPLWGLMLAAQAIDFVWALLVCFGFEQFALQPGFTEASPLVLQYMPVSHSLLPGSLWALAAGLGYKALAEDACWKRAGLIALVVWSHWWLDLLVHTPDLKMLWNDYPVGFGLWRFRIAAFGVESMLLLLAVGYYWRCTRARDRIGSIGLPLLAAFMIALLAYSMWGPIPAHNASVIVQLLIVYVGLSIAAQWIDLHRRPCYA